MNQEQKKPDPGLATPEAAPDEEILQEYTQSFWHNSKFWLWIALAVIFLLFAFVYKKTVVDTTLKPQELKSSLEFFDISSQWVVRDKIIEEDFSGVILVPEVSFRIRNIGKKV